MIKQLAAMAEVFCNSTIIRQIHWSGHDVYTGDKLPEGKKSYALSFVLQDSRKTLTDGQIEAAMSKLQKAFEKELGAVLR